MPDHDTPTGRRVLPLLALAALVPAVPAVPAAATAYQDPAAFDAPGRAAEPTDDGWLGLPDRPIGRLWASVGAGTSPVPLAEGTLDASWDEPATWRLWRATLERAVDPDTGREEAVGARATLALLAAAHGRGDDAWAWTTRLGAGAPRTLAAVVPRLALGGARELGAGGRPGPLADGVVLRPLPPPPPGDPRDVLAWREVRVRGLAVGDATLDLDLELDGTGVQIDVRHAGGGACTVGFDLAAPEGFAIGGSYLDWARQPEDAGPLVLTVRPGDDEHTVFARFRRAGELRPSPPGGALPRQLAAAGLVLELPRDDDPERELAGVVAQELGALLGIEVAVRARADAPELAAAPAPVVVRLPEPAERAATWRYLARAVEERLASDR